MHVTEGERNAVWIASREMDARDQSEVEFGQVQLKLQPNSLGRHRQHRHQHLLQQRWARREEPLDITFEYSVQRFGLIPH